MKATSSFESALAKVLLSMAVVVAPFSATGQDAGKESVPSMTPLLAKVKSLVRDYYPEATLTNSATAIHFEYRAREFMIHEPLMTGDWQDAWKVRGPNRKGVVCEITLYPGKYENPQWTRAADPSGHRYWIHDKRYYRELLFIPYSSAHGCHLYVLLRVPADASQEFIEEFDDLISRFGDYLKPSS